MKFGKTLVLLFKILEMVASSSKEWNNRSLGVVITGKHRYDSSKTNEEIIGENNKKRIFIPEQTREFKPEIKSIRNSLIFSCEYSTLYFPLTTSSISSVVILEIAKLDMDLAQNYDEVSSKPNFFEKYKAKKSIRIETKSIFFIS